MPTFTKGQRPGITSPKASLAATLTNLTAKAANNPEANEEFKKLVVQLADLVESTITPSGLRFPDGSFQSTGLDPHRRAGQQLSAKERAKSSRVEDIISMFLSL